LYALEDSFSSNTYLRTSEVWLESSGWECLLCKSSSDCTEDTWRCREAWSRGKKKCSADSIY